jgi:hypothetical protein
MKNKSRGNLAKLIADVLLSDTNRWWSYYDIAVAIVAGFSRLSTKNRESEMRSYMNRMAEVTFELDSRGFNRLRNGNGLKAQFKVAAKGDGALLAFDFHHQHVMNEGRQALLEYRMLNAKHQKVLPRNWTLESEVAKINSVPALSSGQV